MHACVFAYVYVSSLPASCVEIHSHGCSDNYSLLVLVVKSEPRVYKKFNMGTRSVHDYSIGHQIRSRTRCSHVETSIVLPDHKMPTARAFVGD